jgi:hypothetical protein
MFYRAIYIAMALFMAVSEYRKDGDLVRALAFAVFIAVALDLMYWIRHFGTDFPDRFKGWMTRQRERTVKDRLCPNVPLFVALIMAIVCIGIAAAVHLTFPETCDPESRKWLFRIAVCKQPFRIFTYMSTVGLFTLGGVCCLIAALKLRRR